MSSSTSKTLQNGAIKKSQLTQSVRIGLSRKFKAGSFKSPLIQENVVLNDNSPSELTKESSTIENKNKNNVQSDKSKSLVTPCRRIGLSRKFKTGSFKSPLIQEKIILNHNSPSELNNESPLSLDTSSLKDNKRKSDVQDENKAKRLKKSEPIKRVKKKLIEENLDDNKEDKSVLNVSGCGLLEDDDKNDTLERKEENAECSERLVKNSEVLKLKKVSVCLERLPLDVINLKIALKQCDVSDVNKKLEEKKMNEEKSKRKEELKIKKENISPNKTIPANTIKSSPQTNPNNPKTLSPKTVISQLESKPILNASDTQKKKTEPKQKPKNSIDEYIRKKMQQKSKTSTSSKLSLKKTITKSDSFESDDDFFEKSSRQKSNSQTESINKSDLIEKILSLQNSVGDKEDKLAHYKQAEVYHKLHDVQELNQLSVTWKNGCETALRDLLVKLQEHGSINMKGLLNKLGAPSDLIKYDEENDVFL